MAEKTPIRTVFDGDGNATGLAEFQSGEFIGVTYGGIGRATLTTNSILLGNGTDAVQMSPIQIDGSTISSSDSTLITINDGLNVTGNLSVDGNMTVTGTLTAVNSQTINITNSFTFEGSTADGNETKLTVVDPTADRTITLPNATGTVVLKDTTDTLTNKTIDGATNTLSGTFSGITSLTATTLSDGTLSINSGSITSAVNGTFSGTVNASTDVQVGGISVSTKPFAIAQAVALG